MVAIYINFIYEFHIILENALKPGKSVNYYNMSVLISLIVLIVIFSYGIFIHVAGIGSG